MTLSWIGGFSVGIEVLDRDHQELMTEINRIEAAIIAAEDGVLAGQVDDYRTLMAGHLDRELGLLTRYDYPKVAAFAAAQADLSARLVTFAAELDSGSDRRRLRALWLDYQGRWLEILVLHSLDYKWFFADGNIRPSFEPQ